MRLGARSSFLLAVITAVAWCGAPPILDTAYQNPSFSPRSAAWASELCSGQKYFANDVPPYSWMAVTQDIVGASGVAVMPELAANDVPFTHPFGLDWEFFLAPDAPYRMLLAESNRGPDREFMEATERAAVMGVAAPRGVLGVEIDRGLLPPAYRAREGDRIAIFGNWIVDCGHTDFHTEIHPPLLLATARAEGNATAVSVVARPWLVTERFQTDNEPIRKHLVNEVIKLETMRSLRMEAHPKIEAPFSGTQRLRFTVRPPQPRRSRRDRLALTYHFTVRHGVTVQIADAGRNAISVLIIMDAAKYTAAPLPHRNDWDIPVGWLRQRTNAIDEIQLANAFAQPVAAVLLSRDWLTDRYDAPAAKDLEPETPVSIDDSQPFPIYGQIHLAWERNK
jgi:hypothetical protein